MSVHVEQELAEEDEGKHHLHHVDFLYKCLVGRHLRGGLGVIAPGSFMHAREHLALDDTDDEVGNEQHRHQCLHHRAIVEVPRGSPEPVSLPHQLPLVVGGAGGGNGGVDVVHPGRALLVRARAQVVGAPVAFLVDFEDILPLGGVLRATLKGRLGRAHQSHRFAFGQKFVLVFARVGVGARRRRRNRRHWVQLEDTFPTSPLRLPLCTLSVVFGVGH